MKHAILALRTSSLLPACGFAGLLVGLLVGSLPAQEATQKKPAAAPPALRLPFVPGAMTPVPGGPVFQFDLRADGSCWVAGKRVSTEELLQRIAVQAKKFPDAKRKVLKASRLAIVARMHATLPYEALLRLQTFCSMPPVMLDKLYLAVRAVAKGPETVIPLFIPTEAATATTTRKVQLNITATPNRIGDVARRFAAAAKQAGKEPKPALIFEPDAHTSLEGLLLVVQAARAVGFEQTWFGHNGLHLPAWNRGTRDFAKLVAACPKPQTKLPQMRIGPLDDRGLLGEEVEEEVVEEAEVESNPPRTEKSKFNGKAWNTAVGIGRKRKAKAAHRQVIDRGLAWLASHQDEDGHWDADGFMKHDEGAKTDGPGKATHDIGVTALAILAFLGDGSTLRSGPHKDPIKRGIRWLRTQQKEDGLFGTNATHDFIYDHAIAAYAMSEAYGLSKYRLLRRNAQRGINYLERHRNPWGAWRYTPAGGDNDVSVTSWALMAYISASHFKLEVNPKGIQAALGFLDTATDPQTGRTGYTKPGEASSRNPGDHAVRFPPDRGEAMTAAALFLRVMAGQKLAKSKLMRKAVNRLRGSLPVWDEDAGSIDFYYWYYGTYAMYQVGGEGWHTWDRAITKALVPNQRQDGNFRGSWNPVGAWGEAGGRVYATALATLTLQASYRYTRILQR